MATQFSATPPARQMYLAPVSFFTERALFYRSKKGTLEDLGMAVVVQRMVDADVAGVLFTIDPTRNRRDRMRWIPPLRS